MAPAPPETARILEAGLAQLGFPDSVQADPRWLALAELLHRWSQRLNLTGHQGEARIAQALLMEAAALERVLPPAETLADLGSGAGIPGFPLALCRPNTRFRLIESRERRHHFQRAVIRELGLDHVEAIRGRVEDLPPQPCEGVISQAFAQPAQAVAWMRPWLQPGGWLAIATNPDLRVSEIPELRPGTLHSYAAPDGPPRAAWLHRPAGSP
ncbi:MAG: 16S rRNA (guanine(527)-N(7))-methyltransferase RsmG [Myxococcota bacterium]